MAAKFGVFVDEDHSKLPTLYWLPKLHKRPYKSLFIANSSSCTTAELSILLTSCLTGIKSHVIKYCTTGACHASQQGLSYSRVAAVQLRLSLANSQAIVTPELG